MEENLEEKKEWITPEIIVLDVEKTGKSVKWDETNIILSPDVGPTS